MALISFSFVELDQPLGDALDHVAQQIPVGSFLGELGQCDIGLGGHRRLRRGAPYRQDGRTLAYVGSTGAGEFDSRYRSRL
jgi:hypothetical protein